MGKARENAKRRAVLEAVKNVEINFDQSETGRNHELDHAMMVAVDRGTMPTKNPSVRPVVDPGALRTLFELMDKNKDGEVSRSEVIFALRKDADVRSHLGLPKKFRAQDSDHEKFELVFQSIDEDSSKTISWDEFAWHFGIDPSRMKRPETLAVRVGTVTAKQPGEGKLVHDLEAAMDRARQAFRLFDSPMSRDGAQMMETQTPKGHLTTKEMSDAVRWMGAPQSSIDGSPIWGPVHPSQDACERLARSLGSITERRFVAAVVPAPPCDVVTTEDLVAAFQTFDETSPLRRPGFLTEEEFLEVLTEWGEPMAVEEARRALSHGDILEGGLINYRKYADFICSRIRNL